MTILYGMPVIGARGAITSLARASGVMVDGGERPLVIKLTCSRNNRPGFANGGERPFANPVGLFSVHLSKMHIDDTSTSIDL